MDWSAGRNARATESLRGGSVIYRVVTISREFGSGGAEIAGMLAERLHWKLVDRALIDEVAQAARIKPEVAERFDECVDPWFHRLNKGLWQGGYEGSATATEDAIFDAETMASFSRRVVERSAELGNCVVVGRGAQCILQHRRDTFHVFVYAPLADRIARLRGRFGKQAEGMLEETDRKRAAFIHRNFGLDWTDRHLYHLMISSSCGVSAAVDLIVCGMGCRGGTE
jgi:cytidylate kinase